MNTDILKRRYIVNLVNIIEIIYNKYIDYNSIARLVIIYRKAYTDVRTSAAEPSFWAYATFMGQLIGQWARGRASYSR